MPGASTGAPVAGAPVVVLSNEAKSATLFGWLHAVSSGLLLNFAAAASLRKCTSACHANGTGAYTGSCCSTVTHTAPNASARPLYTRAVLSCNVGQKFSLASARARPQDNILLAPMCADDIEGPLLRVHRGTITRHSAIGYRVPLVTNVSKAVGNQLSCGASSEADKR